MKKISLLFLLVVSMVIEIAARQPMIFTREPLYIYPDSTIVYNILGGDGQKVITIQNPDKSYVVGVVLDPYDSLTIEKLKLSTDTVCPFMGKVIHGNVFDSTGNFVDNMFYSVKNSELKPLTESFFMTGRKWHCTWWLDDNDYDIVFGANGTGTCSGTIIKKGFASQCKSGNARGSNQYQTRYKDYGASGGITGGYSFSIEAFVRYKIKWSINDDNRLYVKLLPNPTVQIKGIKTSMDDSNNPKGPSMTEKQWVKVDIKYNREVADAKRRLQENLEESHPIYPLIDNYIAGCIEGIAIYLQNGKWYTLKESSSAGKTPWDLINEGTYADMEKCSFGLVFETPKLKYVREKYQEIGDYCFGDLVGQYLSTNTIENWLSANKFECDVKLNRNWQSFVDMKKITSITACDSIEYRITQNKTLFGNRDEQLRLKLYYVLTTKKGRKFLTDVCVIFDDEYTPLSINDVKMRYYVPDSFTFLEEVGQAQDKNAKRH